MSFLSSVLTVLLGFAISGAFASFYEGLTGRQAGFRLLREPDVTAVAAVPVVTIGASYILARNLIHGARLRQNTVAGAFFATMIAGLWSLVIGAAALSAFA